MTTFPETPSTWNDVAFAISSGRIDGYQRGHRDGHRAGWTAGIEAGIQIASARDLEFARLVEKEYHRRELQGERASDLVRRLLDAIRTEENRASHPHFHPRPRRAS